MKISIAIATYNGSKYILQQLESIMAQERKADEVIICDDCSADDTVAIIQSFIEENNLQGWTCIRNEKNLGFIKNFYKAISMTSGDYIFLCDQDDIWEKEKIQEIVPKMMECGAEVLNTSFSPIDGQGAFLNVTENARHNNYNILRVEVAPDNLKKFDVEYLLYANISPGCTACFTRKIREMFLLYEDSIIPHDWLINLLAACEDALYFYNKPLTRYRLHDGNTLGLGRKRTGQWAKEAVEIAQTLKYRISVADQNNGRYDKCKSEKVRYVMENRARFLQDISVKNFAKMITVAYKALAQYPKYMLANDLLFFLKLG